MRLLFLLIIFGFISTNPAFANCVGSYPFSQRDLDQESDIVFVADNPEGSDIYSKYNRGFNPGIITFTVRKVFKGDLGEGQKVDVEFLKENGRAVTGTLGRLYLHHKIVAAKYQDNRLVSIGLPEGMCVNVFLDKDQLDSYFVSNWNLTRLKSIFIRYGLIINMLTYIYPNATLLFLGGLIFLLGVGAYKLAGRKKFRFKTQPTPSAHAQE